MTAPAISADTVKRLREMTGAGMMECKNALKEAAGDMDAAVQVLRKAGRANAEKRAGRIVAEGIVAVSRDEASKTCTIAEINCETDFVSRDEQFIDFVHQLMQALSASDISDMSALNDLTLAGGQSVEETRQALITKIGENIQVRRFEHLRLTGDCSAHYIHNGRIAVVVDMAGGNEDAAKDVALHIAASAPLCVNADDVPAETIAKEEEVYRAQAEKSGKPADIVDKIIQGKMRKYLDSVTLLGQIFVKDTDISVGEFLQRNNATVKDFRRYEVGEGVEKAADNFVDEVMSQAKTGG